MVQCRIRHLMLKWMLCIFTMTRSQCIHKEFKMCHDVRCQVPPIILAQEKNLKISIDLHVRNLFPHLCKGLPNLNRKSLLWLRSIHLPIVLMLLALALLSLQRDYYKIKEFANFNTINSFHFF